MSKSIEVKGKVIIIPHNGCSSSFVTNYIRDIASLLNTEIVRYVVLSKVLKIYLDVNIPEETGELIKRNLT